MTPPIKTRPDGTKYPIRGGGGGGTAVVIAGGVAMSVWAASGGIGGLSTGGSATLSAAESAVVRNIKTNLPKARQDIKRGKTERAWKRLNLRKGKDSVQDAVECALFSYGQVREFFTQNPCKDLRRVQFPVAYEGHTMSVLVSRVRMRSARDAREFRSLIDEHGTGDIQPVLPNVRFTGHFYDSDRSRRTVFVAEAESPTGDVPEPVLDATATAAALLARSATT